MNKQIYDEEKLLGELNKLNIQYNKITRRSNKRKYVHKHSRSNKRQKLIDLNYVLKKHKSNKKNINETFKKWNKERKEWNDNLKLIAEAIHFNDPKQTFDEHYDKLYDDNKYDVQNLRTIDLDYDYELKNLFGSLNFGSIQNVSLQNNTGIVILPSYTVIIRQSDGKIFTGKYRNPTIPQEIAMALLETGTDDDDDDINYSKIRKFNNRLGHRIKSVIDENNNELWSG